MLFLNQNLVEAKSISNVAKIKIMIYFSEIISSRHGADLDPSSPQPKSIRKKENHLYYIEMELKSSVKIKLRGIKFI